LENSEWNNESTGSAALAEMLGIRGISGIGFFQILECLLFIMRYLGDMIPVQSQNWFIFYMHRLK
jgi:hypothetical protein